MLFQWVGISHFRWIKKPSWLAVDLQSWSDSLCGLPMERRWTLLPSIQIPTQLQGRLQALPGSDGTQRRKVTKQQELVSIHKILGVTNLRCHKIATVEWFWFWHDADSQRDAVTKANYQMTSLQHLSYQLQQFVHLFLAAFQCGYGGYSFIAPHALRLSCTWTIRSQECGPLLYDPAQRIEPCCPTQHFPGDWNWNIVWIMLLFFVDVHT